MLPSHRSPEGPPQLSPSWPATADAQWEGSLPVHVARLKFGKLSSALLYSCTLTPGPRGCDQKRVLQHMIRFGFESFNKVIKAAGQRTNWKAETVGIMEYWSMRSAHALVQVGMRV